MKNFLFLIAFLGCCLQLQAQGLTPHQLDSIRRLDSIYYAKYSSCQGCRLVFVGVDDVGNRDTIIVGVDSSATVGLDPQFGEIDYRNRPLKPLDLRIIQRDSICWGITPLGDFTEGGLPTTVRFLQNLDLKIDIRKRLGLPVRDLPTLQASESALILKVRCTHYPVTLSLVSSVGFDSVRTFNTTGVFPIQNCTNAAAGIYIEEPNFSISLPNEMDYYPLQTEWYLRPRVPSATEEKLDTKEEEPTVTPNPASRNITISGIDGTIAYSIFSLDGKKLKNTDGVLMPDKRDINIETLHSGMYLLKYKTEQRSGGVRFIVK